VSKRISDIGYKKLEGRGGKGNAEAQSAPRRGRRSRSLAALGMTKNKKTLAGLKPNAT
jgi:hypothetical protein